MARSYFYSLVILTFTMWACNKNDPEWTCDTVGECTEEEYTFIIGLNYGECSGDCAHYLKLENCSLFRDNEDEYFATNIEFSNDTIADADAKKSMMHFQSTIPQYLFDSDETSFGCPDCTDGGALHIIYEDDSKKRALIIDTGVEANPEEIQEWVEEVLDFSYEFFF